MVRETEDRRSGREGDLSIVASGMTVIGELRTEGVVKVDGTVKGNILAGRQVIVSKSGRVDGDIHTTEAVVGGGIVGSIQADERIEVQPGSTIHGDVLTKSLLVHEGGEVNGNVRMGDPKALEQARAAKSAAPAPGSAGHPEPPSVAPARR